jgi:hypothetical protein
MKGSMRTLVFVLATISSSAIDVQSTRSRLLSDADLIIQETENLIASQDPFATAAKGIVPKLLDMPKPRFQGTSVSVKSAINQQAVPMPQIAQPAFAQAQQAPQSQIPGFNFNAVSSPPYMNPFAQNANAGNNNMRFARQPQASPIPFQNAQNGQNNFMFQQQQQAPNWQGQGQALSFHLPGAVQPEQQQSGFGDGFRGPTQMAGHMMNAFSGLPAQAPVAAAAPKPRAAPSFDPHPTKFKNIGGIPPPMFAELSSKVTMRATRPEAEVRALESQYRGASGILEHNSVAGMGNAMPPSRVSSDMDAAYARGADGAMPHGENDPGASSFSFKRSSVTIKDASDGQNQLKTNMEQMYEQDEMRTPTPQQGQGVMKPYNTPMTPEAAPVAAAPGRRSGHSQEEMTEVEKALNWEKTHPNFGVGDSAPNARLQFVESEVTTNVQPGNAENVEHMEAQLNKMAAEPLEAEASGMPKFLRGSSSARSGSQQEGQVKSQASTFGYAHAAGGQAQNSDGGGLAPTYDNNQPAAPEQMQTY